jgi:hypothetical protein
MNPTKNGVNSSAPEEWVVPASIVASVVLIRIWLLIYNVIYMYLHFRRLSHNFITFLNQSLFEDLDSLKEL